MKKYWRVRVILEECEHATSDGRLIFANEIESYRIRASFSNKHKGIGRFQAIKRLISKAYPTP